MTAPDDSQIEHLRRECHNTALNAFGTSYMFERRAAKVQKKLRLLAYFGLFGVVTVGSAVTSFGTDAPITKWLLGLSAVLGIAQTSVSLWALTSEWANRYTYSTTSMISNLSIGRRMQALGRENPPDLETKFRVLHQEFLSREEQDLQQSVTDEEYRIARRAGYKAIGRACSACGVVPTTMDPTDCNNCGNFKL